MIAPASDLWPDAGYIKDASKLSILGALTRRILLDRMLVSAGGMRSRVKLLLARRASAHCVLPVSALSIPCCPNQKAVL